MDDAQVERVRLALAAKAYELRGSVEFTADVWRSLARAAIAAMPAVDMHEPLKRD